MRGAEDDQSPSRRRRRGQRVVDELQRDGVDVSSRSIRASTSSVLEHQAIAVVSSRRTVQPGGTTTVVSYSSIEHAVPLRRCGPDRGARADRHLGLPALEPDPPVGRAAARVLHPRIGAEASAHPLRCARLRAGDEAHCADLDRRVRIVRARRRAARARLRTGAIRSRIDPRSGSLLASSTSSSQLWPRYRRSRAGLELRIRPVRDAGCGRSGHLPDQRCRPRRGRCVFAVMSQVLTSWNSGLAKRRPTALKMPASGGTMTVCTPRSAARPAAWIGPGAAVRDQDEAPRVPPALRRHGPAAPASCARSRAPAHRGRPRRATCPAPRPPHRRPSRRARARSTARRRRWTPRACNRARRSRR